MWLCQGLQRVNIKGLEVKDKMGGYTYEKITKKLRNINDGRSIRKNDVGKYLVSYTGDGWVSTKMTANQVKKFKKDKKDFGKFNWR